MKQARILIEGRLQRMNFRLQTQQQAQRLGLVGFIRNLSDGRIEIEIPFNAPPDRPCKMFLQEGNNTKEIVFEICDQYGIQGDLFSQAILNNNDVPTPLEDAVANMKVIDAIIESAENNSWSKI